MKEKNMTALMSLFIKAYHVKNNKYRIYEDDSIKIISDKEYLDISENLKQGISFFDSKFEGSDKDKLNRIMNILSGSVIGRSIFTEACLKNEIKLGCKNYIIFASGYDMSYIKYPNLNIFEFDQDFVFYDKIKRLKENNITTNVEYIKCNLKTDDFINKIKSNSKFNNNKTFCSLLGISYYLTKEEFSVLLKNINKILTYGSAIVFDYPLEEDINKVEQLAHLAGEDMKSKYMYSEMERILASNNFLVYKNLTHNDIDKTYFYNYNTLNPSNRLKAPNNVNYILAVKK